MIFDRAVGHKLQSYYTELLPQIPVGHQTLWVFTRDNEEEKKTCSELFRRHYFYKEV